MKARSEMPRPASEELKSLVTNAVSRDIYGILYNADQPLTIAEIRVILNLDTTEQGHFDRRLRDLYKVFQIDVVQVGRKTTYELIGKSKNPYNATGRISKSVRAWVLRDQRCKQCGKTPSEDGVKLHADHIIPQKWGGTDEKDNLQALCSECNEGKKNLYSSYNKFAPQIKKAIGMESPHKRIGELLKAFGKEPVPDDLLEVVAKALQYQADWQKRLRELRELGWAYSVQKKKEGKRVRSYFLLEKWTPWPEGNVGIEIRRREKLKKRA